MEAVLMVLALMVLALLTPLQQVACQRALACYGMLLKGWPGKTLAEHGLQTSLGNSEHLPDKFINSQ